MTCFDIMYRLYIYIIYVKRKYNEVEIHVDDHVKQAFIRTSIILLAFRRGMIASKWPTATILSHYND